MILVSISLVDGGLQEFEESDSFLQRLDQLKSEGYEGKSLIHELITDDWGAPPLYVKISGKTSQGQEINEHIPYQ
ncbi:hypothetical protein [Shewanella algae]|uniref:hypothetical protein n=1 Tax=Shewanella algae TaxID=38313 RepID=UPI001AAD3040|nr:hypothetical protein [Shewanella algae]MBO2598609.1 hypothetical protein [Shewanella algae]BCV58979.1 hypothetical protein TUM17384_29240 [Shewanella algae]